MSMERIRSIVKKNIIILKIKKISDKLGGDDIDWLKGYTEEILRVNPNKLDEILIALEDIEKICST